MKKKIAIIGSGPVRIGQGIEFDYCTVHGALSLQKYGYETILINNNPGTVSTDFQMADRLYFEPLHIEDVLNILDYEKPDGVIVQFGGQTAINLAQQLEEHHFPLLSVSQEQIDLVEDRERFYSLLKELEIPHIPGLMAANEQQLIEQIKTIGYPLLLRPSYVIGGQGMIIIEKEADLVEHLANIQYPVLIDAYYKGIELEIDALSDGENIVIPAYFEHIEKAGVHSGDSMTVTPTINISEQIKKTIESYTKKIAQKLNFKGIFNIQFVLYKDIVYMLEVNPRASRTVPIVSKITGVNLIDECIKILTGSSLTIEQVPERPFYTIKNPIFSTGRLDGVDPFLTPEMKSTGELISLGATVEEALVKSVKWNSHQSKLGSKRWEIFVDVDGIKDSEVIERIESAGAKAITEQSDMSFLDWFKDDRGTLLVSLGQSEKSKEMRQIASSAQLTVVTEIETLDAYLTGLTSEIKEPRSLQDWLNQVKKEVLM